MGRTRRQARAQERAEERAETKTLAERRAEAPKGTAPDGGFTHGEPAGIFGGQPKAERD